MGTDVYVWIWNEKLQYSGLQNEKQNIMIQVKQKETASKLGSNYSES